MQRQEQTTSHLAGCACCAFAISDANQGEGKGGRVDERHTRQQEPSSDRSRSEGADGWPAWRE